MHPEKAFLTKDTFNCIKPQVALIRIKVIPMFIGQSSIIIWKGTYTNSCLDGSKNTSKSLNSVVVNIHSGMKYNLV